MYILYIYALLYVWSVKLSIQWVRACVCMCVLYYSVKSCKLDLYQIGQGWPDREERRLEIYIYIPAQMKFGANIQKSLDGYFVANSFCTNYFHKFDWYLFNPVHMLKMKSWYFWYNFSPQELWALGLDKYLIPAFWNTSVGALLVTVLVFSEEQLVHERM